MTRRKGGKRERTRASLIAAAIALIGERGYEGTSLEAVAAAAGMSRGAIYGNFKNRDELFLAVAEAQWQPVMPPLTPGASLKQQMRIVGRAVAEAARARRAMAVGAASFQVYALTKPRLRRRMAAANARIYEMAAKELLKFVPQKDLPMPAGTFVRVAHALTEGLMSMHFLTPELVDDAVIVAAFEALA